MRSFRSCTQPAVRRQRQRPLPVVARERLPSSYATSAFAQILYLPSQLCYQSNLAARSIDEQNGGLFERGPEIAS
jgi:hypothetical protein